MALPHNVWNMAPGHPPDPDYSGATEWLRVTDSGLAIYISPAGNRGPRGAYRPGFDHRWTIWRQGTLLAEGFTDDHFAARSAAVQEADRVEFRICEAIRAMDIRKNPGPTL